MLAIKCVVVGDGAVGKTCLLNSYTTQAFSTEYYPTRQDNEYSTSVVVIDAVQVKLCLYDTTDVDDYGRPGRRLSCRHTDVFLICFSFINPASFENVRALWHRRVRRHFPSAPIILVGTKLDLRDDPSTIQRLRANDLAPVTRQQGEAMARAIGANAYMECSSKNLPSVSAVFSEVVMAYMLVITEVPKQGKSPCFKQVFKSLRPGKKHTVPNSMPLFPNGAQDGAVSTVHEEYDMIYLNTDIHTRGPSHQGQGSNSTAPETELEEDPYSYDMAFTIGLQEDTSPPHDNALSNNIDLSERPLPRPQTSTLPSSSDPEPPSCTSQGIAEPAMTSVALGQIRSTMSPWSTCGSTCGSDSDVPGIKNNSLRMTENQSTLGASTSADVGRHREMKKLVFVGDKQVGKTWLLRTCAGEDIPDSYVPTETDDCIHHRLITRAGVLNLGLWDTSGATEFDWQRPMSYRGVSAIIVCFALDNQASYERVGAKCPEVRFHCPSTPIILVGTKMDLRGVSATLTTQQGQRLADAIGAVKYLECSALKQEGLKDVFEVVETVLNPGTQKYSDVCCRVPQLSSSSPTEVTGAAAMNEIVPSMSCTQEEDDSYRALEVATLWRLFAQTQSPPPQSRVEELPRRQQFQRTRCQSHESQFYCGQVLRCASPQQPFQWQILQWLHRFNSLCRIHQSKMRNVHWGRAKYNHRRSHSTRKVQDPMIRHKYMQLSVVSC